MNTVKIGDDFENICYDKIVEAINNDELAFPLKYARVKRKAKYFSKKSQTEIIFDLAIEIWPPKATNYINLFLIECKSYSSKKVPIGDLKRFLADVNDIAELNGKAVFMTNSSYSEPSLVFAKNTGIMVFSIDQENSYSIIHYKKNRKILPKESEENKIHKQFEKFIKYVFGTFKIRGLKKLSHSNIEKIANQIHDEINPNILKHYSKFTIEEIINSIEKNYLIEFDLNANLSEESLNKTLGSFDVVNNKISIDKSVFGTKRFSFVLAHEIGHLILHRDLKVNKEVYNEFEDSEYDFMTDKYLLVNDKNWVEWQANKFASSLLMPEINIKFQLVFYQIQLGISKYGHIYVDDQKINRDDFSKILTYLSDFFNTSITTIKFRLEELNLVTYKTKDKEFAEGLVNLNFF